VLLINCGSELMKVKRIVIGSYVENCYLLIDDNETEAYIVDPGDGVEKVINTVNDLHLNIKAVLITHGHFDHTNGIKKVKEAFGVKVYMNKLDLPLVTDAEEVDEDIREGDVFELGNDTIKAISTPGHSMGGMCFLCGDKLISGDTLFKSSVGRTDMLGGSYSQLIDSIKTKLMIMPDDVTVYPGHGFSTTIGYEKATNPFINE